MYMCVAIQSFPLISLAIQKFAMIANFYNTPSNFYNTPSNFYNSPSSPFAKGKTRWPVFSVVSALHCKVYTVKFKVYNLLYIGFTLLAGFLVLFSSSNTSLSVAVQQCIVLQFSVRFLRCLASNYYVSITSARM